MHNFQRDGAMRFDGNAGGAQNYEAVNGGGAERAAYAEPQLAVSGLAAHYDARSVEDDFTQAGNLYRLMTSDAKDRLTSNIAGAMGSVSDEIKQRQIGHFMKADPVYGRTVAEKLGLAIKELVAA